MTINTRLELSDIGLFKRRRSRESLSQYERACQWQAQFAECMDNALRLHHCVMPELCATGAELLSCVHLHVDYKNFSGIGIPLTGPARRRIDARLRAIGTLVYREQTGIKEKLPGDIHVPALARISSFPSQRKTAGGKSASRAPARKSVGFFGRLFG